VVEDARSRRDAVLPVALRLCGPPVFSAPPRAPFPHPARPVRSRPPRADNRTPALVVAAAAAAAARCAWSRAAGSHAGAPPRPPRPPFPAPTSLDKRSLLSSTQPYHHGHAPARHAVRPAPPLHAAPARPAAGRLQHAHSRGPGGKKGKEEMKGELVEQRRLGGRIPPARCAAQPPPRPSRSRPSTGPPPRPPSRRPARGAPPAWRPAGCGWAARRRARGRRWRRGRRRRCRAWRR